MLCYVRVYIYTRYYTTFYISFLFFSAPPPPPRPGCIIVARRSAKKIPPECVFAPIPYTYAYARTRDTRIIHNILCVCDPIPKTRALCIRSINYGSDRRRDPARSFCFFSFYSLIFQSIYAAPPRTLKIAIRVYNTRLPIRILVSDRCSHCTRNNARVSCI